MRKKPTQQKRRIQRPLNLKCVFCVGKIEPDYKDHEGLMAYITGRGKMLGRARTGLCQKHQRRLATAIKRARHLARVPFVSSIG